MKLVWLVAMVAFGLICLPANAVTSPWEQPAASLAEEIAGILGPGQARLTIRNLSTVSTDEIPAIRRLLEQDLKAHGVLASGAESANVIRVTLSENARERLWVAEIVEGNETRVAMVTVDAEYPRRLPTQDGIVLRKERFLSNAELSLPPVFSDDEPILAILGASSGLVVLRRDDVLIFAMTSIGWREPQILALDRSTSLPRDQRGVLLASADGSGFTAFSPGRECLGSYTPVSDNSGHYGDWSLHCRETDDPWPIAGLAAQPDIPSSSARIKAFYNTARNYFTGVITPSIEVDLPSFYSAALIPRPRGAGLVINSVDGKVEIAENGALKPVSGTRDWGSDFAALHTSCGAGTQIVASGSGEAATDSLRAYELPGQEAIAASAPLAMDGSVTALWTAPDEKSLYVVVREAAGQYEVDRVTASCN
jgi:hypothetical protein